MKALMLYYTVVAVAIVVIVLINNINIPPLITAIVKFVIGIIAVGALLYLVFLLAMYSTLWLF